MEHPNMDSEQVSQTPCAELISLQSFLNQLSLEKAKKEVELKDLENCYTKIKSEIDEEMCKEIELRENFRNLQEVLRIENMKLDNLKAEELEVNKTHEQVRNQMRDMEKLLMKEAAKKLAAVLEFEEQMTELKSLFHDAKELYLEANVLAENSKVEAKVQQLERSCEAQKQLLRKRSASLQKLETSLQQIDDCFVMPDMQVALGLAKEENDRSVRVVNAMATTDKQLKAKLFQ